MQAVNCTKYDECKCGHERDSHKIKKITENGKDTFSWPCEECECLKFVLSEKYAR